MATLIRRITGTLCLVLAVACACYAFAVRNTHSGTSFWIVWLAFAVLFAILGFGLLFRWWTILPRLVRGILIAVACIGLVAFGTVESCIVSKMHAQGKPDLDYVVVLGAQVRKSGPSLVLRYRLDKAIEYLDENPNTICIVSGGKGPNEPFPEAQGMADYLKEHGIAEQRILEEPDSKTTEENIVNSKKMINDDNASIGVITNNFHMFRALQIADKYGLDNAQGIAAGSPRICSSTIWFVSFSPKSNSCCSSRFGNLFALVKDPNTE